VRPASFAAFAAVPLSQVASVRLDFSISGAML
jgi:hypothetical protein